jgi:hypothetical protein
MSEEKETETTPPKKYSRYRTVRQQDTKVEHPPPAAPVKQDGVSRSMSRYRRPRAPTNSQLNSPPVPSIPIPRSPQAINPSPVKGGTRRVTDPVQSPLKQQLPTRHDTVAGHRGGRESEVERRQRKAQEAIDREAQRQRALKEQEAQQLKQAQLRAEQARLTEEEAKRLLAEQKRKDLERLEAELDAAGPPLPPVKSPGRDKFVLFSRKRAATKTSPPATERGTSNSLSISRTKSDDSPGSTEPTFRVLEQKPNADAPISAVNSGERVSFEIFCTQQC